MHYLLLVYLNEGVWRDLPQSEKEKLQQECHVYGEEIRASKHLLAGAPLEDSSTAVTIRTREGQPVLTDGPFAETKEVLGGYHLVECKDEAEAIGLGKRFPGLRLGMTIEVRKITDLSALVFLPRETV